MIIVTVGFTKGYGACINGNGTLSLLYVAGNALSTLTILCHWILTIALWNKYHCPQIEKTRTILILTESKLEFWSVLTPNPILRHFVTSSHNLQIYNASLPKMLF